VIFLGAVCIAGVYPPFKAVENVLYQILLKILNNILNNIKLKTETNIVSYEFL
jgi:hypothetical protein